MAISPAACDYLRLSLVPGVGVYTAQLLIQHCGSVADVWQYTPEEWALIEGVGPKLIQALSKAFSAEFESLISKILLSCEQQNIQLICAEDAGWPLNLLGCNDAPLILYAKGNLACLSGGNVLGMVGARKASAEGKLIARRWSAYCSGQNVVMVSGMAPGIDSAVHGGSLDAGKAGVAVLGYGFDAGSIQQQKQIEALSDLGCVLSEYAPGTQAHPSFFPQRNRIIAGLAQGLIVIEGGLKSGSLITARQALNYGREIFAVPGSVLNDVHAGCHQLIQDGAQLANDAEYVLRSMGWDTVQNARNNYQAKDENEEKLLDLLGKQIMHIDHLADDCCLTVPMLSTILLRLELEGVIEKLPGSRYTLS